MRKVQMEYAHLQSHQVSQGMGKGRFGISEEAALFAGTHRELDDHRVRLDILDFMSREVENDASIMKNIRKAREERHMARKSKKEYVWVRLRSPCLAFSLHVYALPSFNVFFHILSRDDGTPRRA